MSEARETYGDVTAEYLALHRGAGLVVGRTALTWVSGSDAVSFLDGLLSQAVAQMEPMTAARALLLSPQGKLRAPLWLLRSEDRVGIVSDANRREIVIGDLNRFRIRVDVAIEPGDTLIELWGSEAADVLRAAKVLPPEPATWVESDGGLVASLPLVRSGRARFVLSADSRDALVSAGAVPAGRLALDAVRIELGEPEMGVDLDDATIPQEADVVVGAVDFEKGCYLGQELVARIDSRGRVNRHLRGVVIDENVLPPLGAEVLAGEKLVGTVTSLGESLELRAPVGLALLRREVEPGDPVTVSWDGGHAKAHIRELPLVV